MKGLAPLERRVARLERDLGDDEAWQTRVASMSDDALRAELRRLEALPWELCSTGERQVKCLLGMSDLELAEMINSLEDGGMSQA